MRPYYAQRSYKDDGEHLAGQVGDEPHPREFLESVWGVMAEVWRVLKPTGSCFVNLGDKRAGSGGPGTTSGLGSKPQGLRTQITGQYGREAFGRNKSRQALPERFVIGCEDGLADPEGVGWIYRQQLVWDKPNGLPESVRDRTRDNFEPWYHLVKEGDYYSALDELREDGDEDRPQARRAEELALAAGLTEEHREALLARGLGDVGRGAATQTGTGHNDADVLRLAAEADAALGSYAREFTVTSATRGKMPGSVWSIPIEPLIVPKWLDVEHHAAFPAEWPRRLILGWSPPAICLECGVGRFPVSAKEATGETLKRNLRHTPGYTDPAGEGQRDVRYQIVGYACDCTPRTKHRDRTVPSQANELDHRATGGTRADPARDWPERRPRVEYHLEGWDPPPWRNAVVLDPFGGTGTTAMVARALGRVGISLDLSWDYCRLARWRVYESGHGAKVRARYDRELQGTLL